MIRQAKDGAIPRRLDGLEESLNLFEAEVRGFVSFAPAAFRRGILGRLGGGPGYDPERGSLRRYWTE